MSDTVISVENISKFYRLGQISTGTLTHDLNVWWAKVRGKPNPLGRVGTRHLPGRAGDIIWALKNMSFTVERGDVLGIVGRNGAGKSTLLKILSEVTAPTSGELKIRGRIASLLEVGTGFHPDLTGRENVYLNGAILGMTKQEIRSKFDEIVDFADIGQFLDTPVKRYSSGMYVRLAFAVAAHLEPEILVVDEVLAVGDAEFQRKCLGKMGSVAQEGRTVLFVSHNLVAIQTLCQRALWLDSGQLKEQGPVSGIVAAYLQSGLADHSVPERVWKDIILAAGNDTIRLHRISVLPEQGKPGDLISMQTPFRIEVEYWNLRPLEPLHAVLQFYNDQGIIAFTTRAVGSTLDPVLHGQPPTGLFRSICHIPANLLNSGFHRIDLFLMRSDKEKSYIYREIIGFEVIDNAERKHSLFDKEPGVICPDLVWETEFLGSSFMPEGIH